MLLCRTSLVCVHLCASFRNTTLHDFVPSNFGCGAVIPIIKDKTGNVNNVNNYRGRLSLCYLLSLNCLNLSCWKSVKNLQESYCLPMTFHLSSCLVIRLTINACWNCVLRKNVCLHKHETVKCYIDGIGCLNFKHIRFCCKFLINHEVAI